MSRQRSIPLAVRILTGGFAVLSLSAIPALGATLDDFEDGNITEYSVASGTVTAAATGAAAHDGNFGLEFSGAAPFNADQNGRMVGGTGWLWRDDAGAFAGQGDIISWWTRSPSSTGRNYIGFGASIAGCYSVVLGLNTASFIIQRNDNYDFLNLAEVPHGWVAFKWYRVELIWSVGGGMAANLYDTDGTTLLNTVVAADNTWAGGGIAFRSFSGPGYFDTVTTQGPISVDSKSWGGVKSLYR
jgi:hypothetical protein